MGTGQTHLNSDSKIADEGRPQGGEGTHKGCPYLHFSAKKPASSRQRRMEFAIAHYDLHSSRRYALGRAPTRGAPTNCLLSGVMPWGGHPQGAPLPLSSPGVMPWGGTHKGRPYQLSSPMPWGGTHAPTNCLLQALWGGHPQGAPLPIVFSKALCPGEGAHKGCPYQLSSPGVMPWGGHPQGAPLPIVFSRRYALRRAPTRGAPTNCLLQALCPEEGTHKGRPYQLSSPGVMPCPYQLSSPGVMGGHPQGAPLPIVFSRRYALRRAPTRPLPIVFSRVMP